MAAIHTRQAQKMRRAVQAIRLHERVKQGGDWWADPCPLD